MEWKKRVHCISFILRASILFFLCIGCSSETAIDWLRVDQITGSPSGDVLYLKGALRAGEGKRFAWTLDLRNFRVVEKKASGKGQGGVAVSKPFSFKIENDFLVMTPEGGEAIRHYIVDLPAHVSVVSGLPVSRFHGKRGHFMRIQGVYPGGVVVREPKRLHRGGGFADAYFPLSPEGTVGAEIALPANGVVTNHRVLYLTRTGVLLVARDNGRSLQGINARDGRILFTHP